MTDANTIQAMADRINAVRQQKAAIMRNMELGIIGNPDDFDALLPLLTGCATLPELDAFKRTAERWRLSAEPYPEHLTLDEAVRMTRN